MEHLLTLLAVGEGVDKVGGGNSDLVGSITDIINAVIFVLGIVAVIVVIIGGISYMTSTGDAGKVKKAKDIILYGIIGLIVCVLSYVIVNFVIVSLLNSGQQHSKEEYYTGNYESESDCKKAIPNNAYMHYINGTGECFYSY